jgi:hypothetical protein
MWESNPRRFLLSEEPSIDQPLERLSRQHQNFSEVTGFDLLQPQSTIVVDFPAKIRDYNMTNTVHKSGLEL